VADYPPLTDQLRVQVGEVPASHDGGLAYRPCAVTLEDGSEDLAVYVVPYRPYIRVWGVRPEDDPGKRSVPVSRIRSVRDSPLRLPASLADELYAAGESGMGYTVFTVEFSNGATQAYVTGNAVDFIDPPVGCAARDARRVFPHRARDQARPVSVNYAWCIYGGPEVADDNRMQP
jgi:hypothetical protein